MVEEARRASEIPSVALEAYVRHRMKDRTGLHTVGLALRELSQVLDFLGRELQTRFITVFGYASD